MAINPLKLTRGLGNGTFLGSIARRVTQGFAISEQIVVTPLAFGVLSFMSQHGQGVTATISPDGKGVMATISQSMGVFAIISQDGQGVAATISSNGIGVEDKL